jgi:hypothetical protein
MSDFDQLILRCAADGPSGIRCNDWLRIDPHDRSGPGLIAYRTEQGLLVAAYDRPADAEITVGRVLALQRPVE